MKKIYSTLLTIIVLFLLTSCVVERNEYYSPSQSTDQIKSISIHYATHDTTSGLKLGDTLATIDSNEYESFCEELKTLLYTHGIIVFPPVAQDPNFYHHGYLINIEYTNGGYDRLTQDLRSWENGDQSGAGIGYCDEEDFYNIIEKYTHLDCHTEKETN